jgi:hypothetical protein
MGSGALIQVPSFIKIGSGVQKLIGVDTQTHRQQRDLIKTKLRGFGPRANYTDRATAACW